MHLLLFFNSGCTDFILLCRFMWLLLSDCSNMGFTVFFCFFYTRFIAGFFYWLPRTCASNAFYCLKKFERKDRIEILQIKIKTQLLQGLISHKGVHLPSQNVSLSRANSNLKRRQLQSWNQHSGRAQWDTCGNQHSGTHATLIQVSFHNCFSMIMMWFKSLSYSIIYSLGFTYLHTFAHVS